MSNLKLYIAVLDTVPNHMVPVLVAHAILGADMSFTKELESTAYGASAYLNSELSNYVIWKQMYFSKVVLKVNRKEFDKISQISHTFLAHENTVLKGTKSCAVVCPRTEYPNVIKFAKMWQPS
jgi:hypothetical protein